MSNPIDWNIICETTAVGLASEIPVIGGAVSFLIGNFWGGTTSVWDQIQAQVAALVEQNILVSEYNDRKESIDGLQTTLNRYVADITTEKGATLVDAIGKADDLYSHLTDMSNGNTIHYIPLAVAASHLHLTLLAEQLQHGVELFGLPSNPDWANQLTNQRLAYRNFFRTIYPIWLNWRLSQIIEENGRTYSPFVWTAHGKAQDNLTGVEIYYDESGNSNSDAFKAVAYASYDMLVNRAIADMAQALASTFLLNLYDPVTANNPPDVDPALAYLTLGPFCPGTLWLDGHSATDATVLDMPGTVTGISINAGNSIDGFQLHYDGYDGWLSGPGSAGGPGAVPIPPETHCTGFEAGFANGLMYVATVHFSDGTTAGPFGNAGNWQGKIGDGTVSRAYALTGAGYAGGSGPSSTSGTGVITLQFAHASLFYDARKYILPTGYYLSTSNLNYLAPSNDPTMYCNIQTDGNLCIHSESGGTLLWQSNTPSNPTGPHYVVMQADGNLCIYAGDSPPNAGGCLWQSGSGGAIGDYFAMVTVVPVPGGTSGQLNIYSGKPGVTAKLVWNSSAGEYGGGRTC